MKYAIITLFLIIVIISINVFNAGKRAIQHNNNKFDTVLSQIERNY